MSIQDQELKLENIYEKRDQLRIDKFKEKYPTRLTSLGWKAIPFYRKEYFLRICFSLSILFIIFFVFYAPFWIWIVITGPTYCKKKFGDKSIVVMHGKYNQLIGLLLCGLLSACELYLLYAHL